MVPKKTKWQQKPHWVYQKYKSYKPHLILTPTTISTLRTLQRKKVFMVLLSTHPYPPKEADVVLKNKVFHFKLDKLFDKIIATRNQPNSKTQYILRVIKKLSIPKTQALMVGDSYKWDYQPARRAGIDAVLLDSEYRKKDDKGRNVKRVIKKHAGYSPICLDLRSP